MRAVQVCGADAVTATVQLWGLMVDSADLWCLMSYVLMLEVQPSEAELQLLCLLYDHGLLYCA